MVSKIFQNTTKEYTDFEAFLFCCGGVVLGVVLREVVTATLYATGLIK